MYNKLFAVSIALLLCLNINAQERCGIEAAYDKLFETRPDLETEYQNYLNAVPLLSQIQDNTKSIAPPIITIPVVVHVLHDGEAVGTGQNISAAQVEAQLEVMNDDFLAQNSNFSSTPAQWQSVIGNPEIQFCLASVDPNGNPTDGIDRQNLAVTGSSINNSNIESSLKPQTAWNTNLYYNIWVLDIPGTSSGGGVLGYAYLPQGGIVGNDIDGVVCDYRWFGGPGFNISGYKTMTHETGHYLGLPHTFGNGTGCGDDDGIADTPDISDATSSLNAGLSCGSGFPTGPISCGNEHMYVNYMDYVNDSRCYTSFSQGQINVMRAVLEGNGGSFGLQSRTQLVANTATACITTADDAGIAAINYPNGTVCANPVTPIITIQNYGSNTLTSATITCTINGGAAITFNWTGSLAQGATQQVTLNSFTAPVGSFVFECSTSNPNGATDEDTSNDSQSTTNIFTSVTIPYAEGFESTAFPPNNMSINNPNGDEWEWTRSTAAGGYGTSNASAFFDNYNDDDGSIRGSRDWLILPPLDLGGTAATEMTFDWAHTGYAGSSTVDTDSLLIWVSADCGTNWTEIFRIGGTDYESATAQNTAFTPSGSQWASETIDLSTYDGQASLIIAFINDSDWGNNAYLDNINIDAGSSCAFTVSNTSNGVSCNGACDGSATVSASGSTNVSYLWNSGQTTASINNLCAGTYTVTVSDGNCDRTSTITIAEPAAISLSNNVTDVSCNGLCDGSIIANASGGTFPFTYQWDNGANTASLNGLCAGTYNVTVTDANNCVQVSSAAVNAPTAPQALPYQQGFESTIFPPAGMTLNNPTGDEWLWDRTSAASGFGTSAASALFDNYNDDDGSIRGTKDWLILPALNLSGSSNTELTFDWAHTSYAGSSTPDTDSLLVWITTDCGINWTEIFRMGGTDYESAPATASNFVPTANQWQSQTLSLSAYDGQANVQVAFLNHSDWGNNAYLDNISIDATTLSCSATVTSMSVSCSGQFDGSANATVTGGTAPYSYQWDNGETSNPATFLSAGNHSVTITDANNCEVITSFVVNTPAALVLQSLISTPVNCFGGNDGTASITVSGGTLPYTYQWNTPVQTGNTATNLTAGSYTVIVTDANACTLPPINITIEQPSTPITTILNKIDPSCNGGSDGSASVIAQGGTPSYTYAWSSGGSTPTISGLPAGIYTATVTDANGCTYVDNTILNEPAPIVANIVSSEVSCFGDQNGTILIDNVSGGTAPYVFSLDGATYINSNFFGGLAAGSYSVFIQDINACVETTAILVPEPDELILNVTSTPSTMGNDGTATANASGSTPPYIYAWSDGQTGTTATGLAPGTYTVVVTDANGCTTNASVFVDNMIAINNLENLSAFNVYPNPTNGQFVVDLSFSSFEHINISLVNTIGQVMYKEVKSGMDFNIPIDLATQAAGVYFVVISTDRGRVTERIVLLK